jgi:Tfp pilus assembly protein PilN/Tfp pilus assembly PilM family ATPase
MRTTTIDIGARTLKYVAFQNASAVAWNTEPLAGAVKNGLILEPEKIGQQIKALFSSAKLPREKVIYSLNGLPFSYRFFTLPEMDQSSISEALTRMTRQEMPLAPEEMYLSWRVYPAEKDEHQFLVTGVARKAVDVLIKMSVDAGVKPSLLCLPHLSLAALTDRDNAVIVDYEPDYTNLTLVVHGIPAGMHTVQLSGLEASRREMTGQLMRELTRMTGFYNDNHHKNPLPDSTPILLTGQLSGETETADLIRETTGYPVEILKELPANTLNVPSEVSLATYAINLGDVLQENTSPKKTAGSIPSRDFNLINIIEERSSSKKPRGFSKKMALWTALEIGAVALIIAFLMFYQAGNRITQLNTELQNVKQELQKRQESVKQARQAEENIKQISSRVQQVNQQNQNILNPRDSVADLKLLTQSFPPLTTFETIDVTSGQINIKGITTSQEQVMNYVRTLETSGGFSAVNLIWIDRAPSGSVLGISFLITIIR